MRLVWEKFAVCGLCGVVGQKDYEIFYALKHALSNTQNLEPGKRRQPSAWCESLKWTGQVLLGGVHVLVFGELSKDSISKHGQCAFTEVHWPSSTNRGGDGACPQPEERGKVSREVLQAIPGGTSIRESTLLEARLVNGEGALRAGLHQLCATGKHCCSTSFAAQAHGRQGTNHVDRARVGGSEGLQEHFMACFSCLAEYLSLTRPA